MRLLFQILVIAVLLNFQANTILAQNSIELDSLKSHVKFISSDYLKGRKAGKTGEQLAGKYIANKLQTYLVSPPETGYFQNLTLIEEYWNSASISFDSTTYSMPKDLYGANDAGYDLHLKDNDILFLGYGIESEHYNDYKDIDVKNKILFVFDGEPMDYDGKYLVTKTPEPSKFSLGWREKAKIAKEKGAKALLIYGNSLDFENSEMPYPMTVLLEAKQNEIHVNTFFVSPKLGDHLFSLQRKNAVELKLTIAKHQFSLPISIFSDFELKADEGMKFLSADNVMAFVPAKKETKETIVITGHYDHLGVHDGKIYNGADDNATGVAFMMESARIFQRQLVQKQGNKRNLLFVFTTAEEAGLWGSYFFVNHPIIPLSDIVCNINFDMIGRGDEAHPTEDNYLYLISSPEYKDKISTIHNDLAKDHEITIDERYNDPEHPMKYYQRSDQYPFIEKGIPAFVLSGGVHEDYHTPNDTYEKINWDLFYKRSQFIYKVINYFANDAKF